MKLAEPMDSLQSFVQRIEAQLAASRELPVRSCADFEQSMGRFASQLQQFETLARHMMADIIRPRMERLTGYFPEAKLSEPTDAYHCTCWLASPEHSLAMAVLQIGIDHDERLERLVLTYELNIVPAFLPYERHDKLVLDLVPARVDMAWRTAGSGGRIDEQEIVTWVEASLLRFVETYLRLQACGGVSDSDVAADPVCGMVIKKVNAKGLQEYKGHRYYFCSEKCGELFAASPGRFARVAVE